jgi:hypothetical protein
MLGALTLFPYTPSWCITQAQRQTHYIILLRFTSRHFEGRESSVSIAIRLWAGRRKNRGSIPRRGRFVSCSQRLHRLWCSTSIVYNIYRGPFPRRKRGRGVKLTSHFHLVPRLRMMESYLHSPTRLPGVVLNYLSTETTLYLYFTLLCFTRVLLPGVSESYVQS